MRARVEVIKKDGKMMVVEGKVLHVMNADENTLHIIIIEPDFYGFRDLKEPENG